MDTTLNKVPVLVLAFNRADHVEQAMQAIREYKPERLYLECDGARPNKKGEAEAVALTRKTMLDLVDWPCEVKTLFRDKNLGCANAVYDAISWFFEHEEWGVIIEDDIVVSQDFFKLCEDLLPRYKNESRIMEISAQNRSNREDIDNSYIYSQCYHCWGWATWADSWKKMDMKMKSVPQTSIFSLIKKLGWFRGSMMYYYFWQAYRTLDTFNSWATRWYLSILNHDGLVLCPGANLAINIGMDGGAHYEKGDEDPFAVLKIRSIKWPLVYNDTIQADPIQRKYDNDEFFHVRIIGLKKKLKKILNLRQSEHLKSTKK